MRERGDTLAASEDEAKVPLRDAETKGSSSRATLEDDLETECRVEEVREEMESGFVVNAGGRGSVEKK